MTTTCGKLLQNSGIFWYRIVKIRTFADGTIHIVINPVIKANYAVKLSSFADTINLVFAE